MVSQKYSSLVSRLSKIVQAEYRQDMVRTVAPVYSPPCCLQYRALTCICVVCFRTEEVDLVNGSQYLLRYEPIHKLLHKGDVHLI